MRWLAPLALLAAFGGSAAWLLAATRDEPERPAPPPGAAVGFRFESRQLNDGPLPLRQVSFPAGDGRGTGLLTVPPGRRDPMPAVVYVHGLGADSSDFAAEAIFMAAKGAVTLAIDAADAGPAQRVARGVAGLREDLRIRRATAARIQAAVTLVAARRDVDRERVALVGFSRGAAVSALAAERLDGLAAEIYVSGAAGAHTWPGRLGALDPPARAEADRLLDDIDPVRAFDRTRWRRPRLVQFGTRDEVVPVPALRRFARAVPDPKTVTRRATRHALDVVALHARLQWLDRRLDPGPPVMGAPRLTHRVRR